MRKILFATLVIIVALSTIVYAYFVSVSSPETVGPSVSITSPPLQLSLSLDKMNYQTSDNMTVGFSLRNISNKTVTVTKTFASTLGIEPLVPAFTLTTSTEGVSTPGGPNDARGFQFGFTWFDTNGTVVQHQPNLILKMIYDLLLEPNGCLNQTLYISITNFYDIIDRFPQAGTFQIQGSLPGVLVDGVGPITLDTPGIAFTIGQ